MFVKETGVFLKDLPINGLIMTSIGKFEGVRRVIKKLRRSKLLALCTTGKIRISKKEHL